ncbi:MAG: leucine-rich repeat domain-containing protein [Herminiimonas sp.]|nr:leucine-rich repeat domain-containing protein [Herminiimonas sp.]
MQRITGPSTPAPIKAADSETSDSSPPAQAFPAARSGDPHLQNHFPLQGLQRPGLGAPESVNRTAFSAAPAAAATGVTATALRSPMDFFPKVDQWAAAQAGYFGPREAAERIKDAYDNESYDLNLAHLDLTSLPACMFHMTDLRELDISNNQIAVAENLPPNLEQFRAYNNLLQQLPRLPALTRLYVAGNQLSQLPDSTSRLDDADLRRNCFEHLVGLPPTLRTLQAEPALIAATQIRLQENLATQTARLAALANGDTLLLPGNLAHLDPELAESVLARLAPGDADLQSLSHTNATTHRLLEDRVAINKEIAAIDAQIAMFQRFQ